MRVAFLGPAGTFSAQAVAAAALDDPELLPQPTQFQLGDLAAAQGAEGGELLRQIVLTQSDPTDLVDVLAAALIAEAPKRQRLLETRNVLRRFETGSTAVADMIGSGNVAALRN